MGIFGKPAEPEKSVLLQALSYESRVKMPPQGKLPAETIAAVREWVAAGAPIPAVAPSGRRFARRNRRPPRRPPRRHHRRRQELLGLQAASRTPPRPPPQQKDWAANPIDRFILANLEKNGLKPAPPADKTTLLRRATFDLTGLPPTEKEIDDFLADKSPQRLREGGRPPARLAPLRRALGTPLARRHALRRFHRQRRRPPLSARLALSRLRRAGLQRRHAVQPVRARTTGRRHSRRRSRIPASATAASSPPASSRSAKRRSPRKICRSSATTWSTIRSTSPPRPSWASPSPAPAATTTSSIPSRRKIITSWPPSSPPR